MILSCTFSENSLVFLRTFWNTLKKMKNEQELKRFMRRITRKIRNYGHLSATNCGHDEYIRKTLDFECDILNEIQHEIEGLMDSCLEHELNRGPG